MSLPPIFRLPTELHTIVIGYLVFPETAHLRATCSYFASLIPAQYPDYLDLAAADDGPWAVKKRRLTCAYCARMRPATAFTEREKTIVPGRRSCFECWRADFGQLKTYKHTRFTKERKVKVDGKETGICTACGNRFSRWGKRCAGRQLCVDCFHDAPDLVTEGNRIYNDLNKLGVDERTGISMWDLEDIRRTLNEGPYVWANWGNWCYCCGPEARQVWMEGNRGVNIRRRENN